MTSLLFYATYTPVTIVLMFFAKFDKKTATTHYRAVVWPITNFAIDSGFELIRHNCPFPQFNTF